MAATGTSVLSALMHLRGYTLGPSLYRIFAVDARGKRNMGRVYEANGIEWIGESFIRTVSYAMNVVYYCSPLIAYFAYKRGTFSSYDDLMYYSKFCIVVSIGLASAYVLRGFGRMGNADYKVFYDLLKTAKGDTNKRSALQLYDFDFRSWPVDFKWNDSIIKSEVNKTALLHDGDDRGSILSKVINIPVRVMDYCIAHGVARPMVYPGSVKLLQAAMNIALQQGRHMLIEKDGLRSKLLTADGNEIDTMFLDKRSDQPEDNGNTLVICCEGNAAFYEAGCLTTPMKAGFSVLGWNHPGFLGSSGQPFPESEQNAIDVVMRYAVTRLGFDVKNIIVFAWSIGGYTASYAAMMYPQIKGLILDATFDNINALATARMPTFLHSIVKRVIKNYMNLDVARNVMHFPGPVQFIRRTREEIITTIPQVPSTNRGNYLLIKLLLHRYPNILTQESVEVLSNYLGMYDQPSRDGVMASMDVNLEDCAARMRMATGGVPPAYPTNIGQDWSQDIKSKMTLFLAYKYMKHFDSTHCMPLPANFFLSPPWKHE